MGALARGGRTPRSIRDALASLSAGVDEDNLMIGADQRLQMRSSGRGDANQGCLVAEVSTVGLNRAEASETAVFYSGAVDSERHYLSFGFW